MTIMQSLHGLGYDGYSVIDFSRKDGWRAISGWGRDGWDLGSWPYVIVFFRERDNRYEAAYYVEGDVDARSFASEEARNAWVDDLAFYHWTSRGDPWVEGLRLTGPKPEHRGPFSWARLERERSDG